MSQLTTMREQLCVAGESLYSRCLTHGKTGNLSLRLPDGGWLMTPTGSSLGTLDPARLSLLAADGRLLDGDPPTKEAFLHRALYEHREDARAVVHLHSTHSVAVSCLADIDPHDVLPPLTAYYAMRVGRLPLVPFYPPGDQSLADAVAILASRHHAILLANHGPVVAGSSLSAALDATEELEETAKLFLLLQNQRTRPLSEEQAARLRPSGASK